jgi:hypothetical protein
MRADFLRKEQPDLLLLTPLLYFGSQQVDYVRAAVRSAFQPCSVSAAGIT